MDKVTISFVVIEYFSVEEIRACIQSIQYTVANIPHEIIVSSNSCYPSMQQQQLQQLFPTVRWIFNERNGGFAYGMNRGLSVAHGRYLVIANPDVRIRHGMDDLVAFMDAEPRIGAIAPQIVNEQGEIQDSCRPYVSLHSLLYRTMARIVRHQKALLSNKFDYSLVQTVDWVIGAFILGRRAVLEKTRGLDEDYFMYAEDLDWCTRIRKCGYEVVYYPPMQIVYEGSRAARRSAKYARIFFRSHLRYWRKFGFFFGYPKRADLNFEHE